ncbi:MAG TPA: AsmA family protein, partial [Thermodesulfobacteriota bacterium]|nr:AsmA family protein [Thermodesulfobacteriota bacterium]
MGLKRVFEILAGLAVLTAVVVYIVITSYDYNRLKPYITSAVYDATGRTLTLGGDIGIEVSFTPKLIVEDVSFQNAPWGTIPEMASVRRLEAQVALLPLIGGVVEVKRLILVEPEILIETDPSGKKGSNLEFTPPVKEEEKGPAAREAPDAADESGPTLPAIVFYDIRIERARLTYRDGPSGKSHAVGLDLLEAGTTGIESPVKFTIKGDYNDTGFELSGNTGPLTALVDPEKPLSIEVNVVALDTSLKLEGTVKDPLAIRGIEVSFDSRTGDIRKIGKALGKPLPLEGPLNVSGRLSDRGPKSYRISDLKMTLGPSDVSGSVDVNLSGEKPSVNIDLSSEKLDLRPLIAGGAGEARGAGGVGGVGG